MRQFTSWCDEIGKQLVGNEISRVTSTVHHQSRNYLKRNYFTQMTDTMFSFRNSIAIKINKIEIWSFMSAHNCPLATKHYFWRLGMKPASLRQYLAYFGEFHLKQTSLNFPGLVRFQCCCTLSYLSGWPQYWTHSAVDWEIWISPSNIEQSVTKQSQREICSINRFPQTASLSVPQATTLYIVSPTLLEISDWLMSDKHMLMASLPIISMLRPAPQYSVWYTSIEDNDSDVHIHIS